MERCSTATRLAFGFRAGRFLLGLTGLGASTDLDVGRLAEDRPVLPGEPRWHRELRFAELPVGCKQRVLALWEIQLERFDRSIRDGSQGRRGDAFFDLRSAR